MSDTTADRTAHADAEARLSAAAQPDRTDPVAGSATEPSGTSAAPPPEPTQPPVSREDEDEDDDEFIPRGPPVQTAVAGGKKGGRPR